MDSTAPLPIIAWEVVVDPIQICRAKLAGATGITLRFGLASDEVTQQLIRVAVGLGMEPCVLVRSRVSHARRCQIGWR
jgi:indole-3-glycerol phosphate synthase